ncbi:MAG TPA: hypothetical protein VKA89_02080 [Solirubrobacterales bacterium]|nr:hypothetical protein [Solirubrobacterales bacterium]
MTDQLEGEVLSEEDAGPTEAGGARPLPQRFEAATPAVLGDVRTAAIAAAGGALAGVAAVAAARAVGTGARRRGRSLTRRERPANVVASRSFLVDVHLLGNR